MNPEPDLKTRRDAEAFELLEHPEAWPDDPALQAELADLLELHLALGAHPEVGANLEAQGPVQPLSRSFPWLLSAAAVLLVVVPLAYAGQRVRHLAEVTQGQARIQGIAQKRAQDRLWAGFFQQSSVLIQDFQKHPLACETDKENEDRSAEREVAFALLQASHKLAAQGAPGAEAEAVRSDLHAWLMELSLEDGCLDPQRAQELRQWASSHNLEDEAQRLGQLLKGDAS